MSFVLSIDTRVIFSECWLEDSSTLDPWCERILEVHFSAGVGALSQRAQGWLLRAGLVKLRVWVDLTFPIQWAYSVILKIRCSSIGYVRIELMAGKPLLSKTVMYANSGPEGADNAEKAERYGADENACNSGDPCRAEFQS